MINYNPNLHHRKSIRLKGYDYAQAGLYFITLCVQDRKPLFGEIQKGKLKLNIFGKLAKEEWENTAEIRKNISLGEFIIMPNHFHAILQIDFQINKKEKNIGKFYSPSQTIGAIIRGYKGATTKKIKELIRSTGELQFAPTAPTAPTAPKKIIDLNKSIWQRNYYEHIIQTDKAYQNISNYIIKNPEKWQEDKFHL